MKESLTLSNSLSTTSQLAKRRFLGLNVGDYLRGSRKDINVAEENFVIESSADKLVELLQFEAKVKRHLNESL